MRTTCVLFLAGAAAFNPAAQLSLTGRYGSLMQSSLSPLPSSQRSHALVPSLGRRSPIAGAMMASSAGKTPEVGEVDTMRIASYFGATGAQVRRHAVRVFVCVRVGLCLCLCLCPCTCVCLFVR